MKLSPQQAPLYGECVLTVQLCEDECTEEEEEVEFYLLFAGSTQRHLASTLRISQVTLQAICPAHDSSEVVQVTLCSARPGGSVDALAEECFQFVQDLAWDMAHFLVNRTSVSGCSSGIDGQEEALLLDDCHIPLQECERLDASLALALRHMRLPQGWSVLATKTGAHSHAHTDTHRDTPDSLEDPPQVSTALDGEPADTLLHFAARRGLRQVALFLLEQPGGRQALHLPNQHGSTPAHEALKHGHTQLQGLLSERPYTPREELPSDAPCLDTHQHIFPGGRGCLRHHPELNTYTLSQRVTTPGEQAVSTLHREVQDFRKLIGCHRAGEGATELQQQIERLYPARGSDSDDRVRKGRPSANGSSRRTPKRKRGKKTNSSSNNSSATSGTSNAKNQTTADTASGILQYQELPESANHVDTTDCAICPNGGEPGDKYKRVVESLAPIEEGCGDTVDCNRIGSGTPQVGEAGDSPTGPIEEAEKEEPAPQDVRIEATAKATTATAKAKQEQEEKIKLGEKSTTPDLTMGHAQSQEQHQQQQPQGEGETREGGRVKKGTRDPLSHVSEPQVSDSVGRQEAEQSPFLTTMQPSSVTPAALNNGLQEELHTWEDASQREGDACPDSHSSPEDLKQPEEEESTAEEGTKMLGNAPGPDAQPAEEQTDKGQEWQQSKEEIGGENDQGEHISFSPVGEHYNTGGLGDDTQGHTGEVPSGQQETDSMSSSGQKPLLSSINPCLHRVDLDSASHHTHAQNITVSNLGDGLSDEFKVHKHILASPVDSVLEEVSSESLSRVEKRVDSGSGAARGSCCRLTQGDSDESAMLSETLSHEKELPKDKDSCPDICGDDMLFEGANQVRETETTNEALANQDVNLVAQAHQNVAAQEQVYGAASSLPTSDICQDLSYAAVVKRSLTIEADDIEALVEEARDNEEDVGQLVEYNISKSSAPPQTNPAELIGHNCGSPSFGTVIQSELDSSTGSKSPSSLEQEAHSETPFPASETNISLDTECVTHATEPNSSIETESISFLTSGSEPITGGLQEGIVEGTGDLWPGGLTLELLTAERGRTTALTQGTADKADVLEEMITVPTMPTMRSVQEVSIAELEETISEMRTGGDEEVISVSAASQSNFAAPQQQPSPNEGNMDLETSEGSGPSETNGDSAQSKGTFLNSEKMPTCTQPLHKEGQGTEFGRQEGGTESCGANASLSEIPGADFQPDVDASDPCTALWVKGDNTAAEPQTETQELKERAETVQRSTGSSKDQVLTSSPESPQGSSFEDPFQGNQLTAECMSEMCVDGSGEITRSSEVSFVDYQVSNGLDTGQKALDEGSLEQILNVVREPSVETGCHETDTPVFAGNLQLQPQGSTSSSTGAHATESSPEECTITGEAHRPSIPSPLDPDSQVWQVSIDSDLNGKEKEVEHSAIKRETHINTGLNKAITNTHLIQSAFGNCAPILQRHTETDTFKTASEPDTLSHTPLTEDHTQQTQSEALIHTHTNGSKDTQAQLDTTLSNTDTHVDLTRNDTHTSMEVNQRDSNVYGHLKPSGPEPVTGFLTGSGQGHALQDMYNDCGAVDPNGSPWVESSSLVEVCSNATQEVGDFNSSQDLKDDPHPHLGTQADQQAHTSEPDKDPTLEAGSHSGKEPPRCRDVVDGKLTITVDEDEETASMIIDSEIHRQTEVFYDVDSCSEKNLQKSNKECAESAMFPDAGKVLVVARTETPSDGDTVKEPKVDDLLPAGEATSDIALSPTLTEDTSSLHASDRLEGRASWSSIDSWQTSVTSPTPSEMEELEGKDRVTEVPALAALGRQAIRPLSPFRRHSWGPGRGPVSQTDSSARSVAIRSPGAARTTKTTGHRRSVSWCPSDILRPVQDEIGNRSSSLEGLSAEPDVVTVPVTATTIAMDTGRGREGNRAERGSSLVSLTEEELESEMGECSSLDSQKSSGFLRSHRRPPPHSLTKSRSLVAISPKDLDAMGRMRPKRRISFSFSISPLLPKSKTLFSIGTSSSDEEEAVSLASFSSTSATLEYSISEEEPGPLRSDLEGRQATKVSRTFSYLKSKMSKKSKEKDKEKDRLRERDKEAKEKGTINGHLFTPINNAPSTPCQLCAKPLNTKDALICNNCGAHAHKNCRENLPVCAKVKMKMQTTATDSASVQGVIMRNKATAMSASSRDRPKSTITIADDQPQVNPPRKSTGSIMSLGGHIPLAKSVSISNIAGPLLDDMPLKRYLSQSTDSLHKTSKVNESTESLTDEGTEMMDSQLLCEFEADVKELEADSWSATVDKKQLKQLKKDTVKRQDVIYELMQTELHQVRTLRIMGEVYCKGLARELQLEPVALERLFPCLEELTDLHTQLLGALLERRRHTPISRDPSSANPDRGFLVHRIGDVLVNQFSGSYAERLKKVYGKFCSRHNEAVNFYKELHAKDKRFQAFIKKKMSSAIVRRLSIPECILLVTQRITKYPVLIQRILQHSKDGDEEQEDVTRALRLVKDVIAAVDTRVHDFERKRRLKEVYSRTDSKSIMRMKSGQMFAREDLVRGRRLLHDGPLQLKTTAGRFKDVQALLLTDVVVFLQEKDQKYIFAVLDQRSTVISLQKLIVREVANEEKALFLITAGIEKPEMVEVYASSKEERNSWIQRIQTAMQNIEKDEDEGIPSESEEDKRLQENKVREMRDQLHQKDEQIVGLLEEKVKLFRELCDCAAPDDLLHGLRGRMMFRATPADVTKGEPIMKDAIKEVETLQELVNRSVGGALGHQMSSCQETAGGSVGPVCLPRRAETFGGFDSHQMNISKNGEKDEGEDLRRTESDSVLKKGGNANLLLLLKRNSEQVLNSVTHLHGLLLALQAIVVQQDSFIEDQRQALIQRSSSFSSTSSISSSTFSFHLRPSASISSNMSGATVTSTGSSPTNASTATGSSGLGLSIASTTTSCASCSSAIGDPSGAPVVACLADQERALSEERRRWHGQCEVRERELAEREQRLRHQEEETAVSEQRLDLERRRLCEREQELQRDLRLLQEREEEMRRESERLREAQSLLDTDRELQQPQAQEQFCRPHRTPSTTSEDSMKFQSSGSLDRIPTTCATATDGDLSVYSTSPASGGGIDLFSRLGSRRRKGKGLNPFSSSSSSTSSSSTTTSSVLSTSAPGPQQVSSRLLQQLTKPKEKKEKKKKKSKGQDAAPTDAPNADVADAPMDGEVFFC